MELRRVEMNAHSKCRLQCCECGTWHPEISMYADLQGKAFQSFYCQECVERIAPRQQDGTYVLCTTW
jgi:late competence protein required for DNA uptake (superfamily II DNA/RNA helicase)